LLDTRRKRAQAYACDTPAVILAVQNDKASTMQAQERVARDPQDLFRFGEFVVQLFHYYTPQTELGAR
jgi:hypothetical protein